MCTVSAWPTHWYPMVAVLWGLQAAGHQVAVVCPPSQAAPVTRAGLTPAPVLAELDIAFLARLRNVFDAQAGAWPYDWPPPHPVTGAPMKAVAEFGYAEFTRAGAEKIARPVARNGRAAIAFAREYRPDLVLHEPLAMEGLLAARVVGVASAVHLWGPIGTHERDPAAASVVEYPVGSFAPHGAGAVALDTVGHVIDPCPEPLGPVVDAERLAVRYTPYNGPEEVPAWLLDPPTRPRVAVVWGTSLTAMYGPGSFAVPLILDALAGLDVEVVVCTSARDAAGVRYTRPGVRVVAELPLHLLLPTCAAVVHHGGAGCLMTAVATGVPQVVLPTGMDQPVNAARLAATGAAISVPRAGADPEAVRAAVAAVVGEPSYRAAAAALRRSNDDRGTPAELVGGLEKLAAR
ncbi:nucleotide disphospho-sugar-binding domain-containing protein [Actinoplanes nipponensis]|nr:nucleotide disphospho-sugar-binding domain-containing protein [Actinoplanes nipponensis]